MLGWHAAHAFDGFISPILLLDSLVYMSLDCSFYFKMAIAMPWML